LDKKNQTLSHEVERGCLDAANGHPPEVTTGQRDVLLARFTDEFGGWRPYRPWLDASPEGDEIAHRSQKARHRQKMAPAVRVNWLKTQLAVSYIRPGTISSVSTSHP
jgi:hypothetical protein